MDFTNPTFIALAGLIGIGIGWVIRILWHRQEIRRQAAHDVSEILKEKRALLEDRITKTNDPGVKSRLVSQRDDVYQELFALQDEMLGHALKDANLSTEEELIAAGRNHLKPREVTPLKQGAEKVETLSLLLVRDLPVLVRAYFTAQQYKDAKRINDIILTSNPNDPDALNNRGVIYAHLEKEA